MTKILQHINIYFTEIPKTKGTMNVQGWPIETKMDPEITETEEAETEKQNVELEETECVCTWKLEMDEETGCDWD